MLKSLPNAFFASRCARLYNHFSEARTIFSRSFLRFLNCFLVCLRSFSSLLLMALSSSPLISPAFFTTLGMCLWRLILLISGMWAYRSERASLYSRACLCFALLIPSRFEAFARHSLIFPSSEPDSTNRESCFVETQGQYDFFGADYEHMSNRARRPSLTIHAGK